jgi:hypothetical protein
MLEVPYHSTSIMKTGVNLKSGEEERHNTGANTHEQVNFLVIAVMVRSSVMQNENTRERDAREESWRQPRAAVLWWGSHLHLIFSR